MNYDYEIFIDSRCIVAECPVWDERTGKFYFIDLIGGKLFSSKDGQIDGQIDFGKTLGFAIPREKGGFIVGLPDGFYTVDFDGREPEFIASPEPGRADGRFNDGKVDPYGRIWGGTMPTVLDCGYGDALPDSGLYSMDANHNIKKMLGGVIHANGTAWSNDNKKFYFVDSQRLNVCSWDYDIEKNVIANQKVVITIPTSWGGIPDGMTIDEEGKLWVGIFNGHRLTRWDPETGALLAEIIMPCKNVTSCCFGGPDMDELYITTCATDTDLDMYPHAGAIFMMKPGVKGAKTYRYKD